MRNLLLLPKPNGTKKVDWNHSVYLNTNLVLPSQISWVCVLDTLLARKVIRNTLVQLFLWFCSTFMIIISLERKREEVILGFFPFFTAFSTLMQWINYSQQQRQMSCQWALPHFCGNSPMDWENHRGEMKNWHILLNSHKATSLLTPYSQMLMEGEIYFLL